MPNESSTELMIRCSVDRAFLTQNGQEPHRYICPQCNANYMLVMQLVPVPPLRRLALPAGAPPDAEPGP